MRYNTAAATDHPNVPLRLGGFVDAGRCALQKFDILAKARAEIESANRACQADVDADRARLNHDWAMLAAAMEWVREALPPKPEPLPVPAAGAVLYD